MPFVSKILRTLSIALVALSPLVVSAAFAVGPSLSSSAPAPRSACAKTVIRDWANDGVVEGNYHPTCFTEAIRQLPEDLRAYSSAEEDIHHALQHALLRQSSS